MSRVLMQIQEAEALLAAAPRPSCRCEKCVRACRRPCWPTPDDAERLLDAGHGSMLMLDSWCRTPDEGGFVQILSPANPGYERGWAFGAEPPDFENPIAALFNALSFMKESINPATAPLNSGCAFQAGDGRCDLHEAGLKPSEGAVIMACAADDVDYHLAIASTWATERGRAVVERWRREFFRGY